MILQWHWKGLHEKGRVGNCAAVHSSAHNLKKATSKSNLMLVAEAIDLKLAIGKRICQTPIPAAGRSLSKMIPLERVCPILVRMATQSRGTPSLEHRSALRSWLVFLLAWGLIAALAVVAVRALHGPKPKPATGAESEFSAELALIHVREIASVPHPIGSPANDAVRNYLMAQLGKLGLEPQIFTAIGVHQTGNFVIAGRTNEIIGRLSGSEAGPAIVLMAHYDSVSRAPGAGDDGSGVASILETLRALRRGPGLKRDLIVLFTEGEEAGLLGAEAFAHSHPWAKEVGLILNFEARGDRGPSLLFETSVNNRALIEGVASAAPHPIGSSFFYELYKLLPNDTDFTVFRPLQVPGLNFAFGEGLKAYHTPLDTPDNLSLASLQHDGSYSLALVRYFGQMDLKDLKIPRGDDVFFNWFGGYLMAYGQGWVLPGEAVASILLAFFVAVAIRRGEARTSRLLLALPACVSVLIAIPALAAAGWWVVHRILRGRMIFGDSSANLSLLCGLLLLGASAGILMVGILHKYFTNRELSISGLILWCISSWVLALRFPSGSYLLFWPLLFVIAGTFVSQILPRRVEPRRGWIGSVAGVAVAVLLFAPVVYLFYIFLTFGLISVLASAILLGLFFLVAIPFMEVTAQWWNFASMAVAATILLGLGIGLSHYTPAHPKQDTIVYGLDADDNTAAWISYDQEPDAWTKQFLTATPAPPHPVPNYLAGFQRPLLSATTPVVQLAPPVIENVTHKIQGQTDQIKMTLRSPRNADALYLRFANDLQPLSVKVAGRDIPVHNGGRFGLTLFGMKADGVELEIAVKAPSGISFWVMDRSSGLPVRTQPRPTAFIGAEGSDVTFVCHKYTL